MITIDDSLKCLKSRILLPTWHNQGESPSNSDQGADSAPRGHPPGDFPNFSHPDRFADAIELVASDPPPAWSGSRPRAEEDVPNTLDSNVTRIAQSIIDLICSTFASNNFPSDKRPLFGFVPEVLHQQIAEQRPALVSDICMNYHDRIDGIIADQRRVEPRLEILEKAREARRRNLGERTEHYSCLAAHMNEVRFHVASSACVSPAQTEASPPTTDPPNCDPDTPRPDFRNKVVEQCLGQLSRSPQIPKGARNTANYSDFPVTLSFAFLLCSLSRPVLRLARRFLLLPCDAIIYCHYRFSLARPEKHLQLPSSTENQFDLFMRLSDIQEGEVVSVAVDAMAMTPDHRPFIAAKSGDYLFLDYAQPLSRSKRCLVLRVLHDNSGKAGNKVQLTLNNFCKSLSDRNTEVRYACSDGDSSYNKRHYDFVMKWHPVRLQGCLMAAREVVGNETIIPVPGFPHLSRNFCNKIKNHPVTICPELPDTSLHIKILSIF
jgi:hypothetical protein